MRSYNLQTIGNARGNPRFYKQGKRLALAGFAPGVRFNAEIHREEGMVALVVDSTGDRMVSKKPVGESDIPVIDINSAEVLEMFEGMNQIRVIVENGKILLLALATEVRRKERLDRLAAKLESGEALSVGSSSHGAGVLSHAIHAGLKASGISVRLAFANDIEGDYIDQAEAHNDAWDEQTISIVAPLQELAFDTLALSKLPKLEIFEAGLPCVGASVAGRAKKHLEKPEDDINVGHLIVGYLSIVAQSNPAICVLENVVPYMSSASYSIFKNQMRDFGYEVFERVLEGRAFGAMENRKRMCAVAVTKGLSFDFDDLEMPEVVERRVAEILDPIAADDPVWSEMAYLKTKEIADKAAGKSFARQELTGAETSVPTVTRGYQKRRSTDPMLVNPENPNLLRLFTPGEHARIKGVPEHLIAGLSATRAHEVLGQGICYAPFFAVGKLIGKAFKAFSRPVEAVQEFKGQQFELLLAA